MTSLGKDIIVDTITGSATTGLLLNSDVFCPSLAPDQVFVSGLTRISQVVGLGVGGATASLKPDGKDIVSQVIVKNTTGAPQPLTFDMGANADSYNDFMLTICNVSTQPCDLTITGTDTVGVPYTAILFGGGFPVTLSAQTSYTYIIDGQFWTTLAKTSNAP